MKQVILTSFPTGGRFLENTYYIIKDVIKLPYTNTPITASASTILDFRGGRLEAVGSEEVTLQLNGAQIVAPAYNIFRRVTIVGYANDYVRAEWYHDAADPKYSQTHEYINRAIVEAKGCPVLLEPRTYELTDSIIINGKSPLGTHTLISPGILSIQASHSEELKAAIVLDTGIDSVVLDIATIIGVPARGASSPYACTGILFKGNVYNATINLGALSSLVMGLDLSPDLGKGHYAGVQYSRINFQQITAKYCIYIGVLAVDNVLPQPDNSIEQNESDKPKPEPESEPNWVTESQFYGGRLSGGYGIFMSDPKVWPERYETVNALTFNNITFENLTDAPVRLYNAFMCMFRDIRFGSRLPDVGAGKKWMEFNNAKYIDVNVLGAVDYRCIKADGISNMVVINGKIISSSSLGHMYNRLVVVQANGSPVICATSSVQPCNMMRQIIIDDSTPVKRLTVRDLLAVVNVTINNKPEYDTEAMVLSQTILLSVLDSTEARLDLTSYSEIECCVSELQLALEKGCALIFETHNSNWIETPGRPQSKTFKVNTNGTYRISLTAEGNIFICQVGQVDLPIRPIEPDKPVLPPVIPPVEPPIIKPF